MEITADEDALAELDSLPNLTRRVNEPTLVTFSRMVRCDVLITSRSSLSACAHYLNPGGLTIFHPFWHAFRASDAVAFDSPDLDERVERFIWDRHTHGSKKQ